MGNNDLTSSENILVKVDHNNLMYIDPNSVVVNGMVEPRGIKQEELVMYVNLEADLIPRTTLVTDGGDKNTLKSIAKGTLNFLRNQEGRDYDSSWTNAYDQVEQKTMDINLGPMSAFQNIKVPYGDAYQSDKTGQSFGIDSVNITVKGANFIPQVQINFIDVRGKTLFESPENSPYQAFFHIPWPIFYLTVKGFYGKAIRYRLHLVKFNTRFNDTTGNFEIQTTFIGSTFAFMNDIPLKAVMNCPYMYLTEIPNTKQFNEHLGVDQIKVSKSSRGYRILTSVFTELKQKKLIDQNVPVKTLRELGVIAKTLDKILEKEILDQVVEPKVFAAIKDMDEILRNFNTEVNNWGKINLSPEFMTDNNIEYFYLSDKGTRTTSEKILDKTRTGTLEFIIERYKDLISKSELFNKEMKNKTNGKFVGTISLKGVGVVSEYYTQRADNKLYAVAINKLLSAIYDVIDQFNKQKNTLETDVESKLNEIVMNKNAGGLGFKPTVRNLFGIVLANAEVYIRLMKEVHYNSFKRGNDRKKVIGKLSDESKGEPIYPWPEIKKQSAGNKQKVVVYPAEDDLIKTLKSNDKSLWPEVGFVEEFLGISTNLYDPLAEKEGGVNNVDYVFEDNASENSVKTISTLETIVSTIPYIDKTMSSILYEIYERADYFTLIDSFTDNSIIELANIEFENIKQSTVDDVDITSLLKDNIKTPEDLLSWLERVSQFERYPYFQDKLPTTPYLKEALDSPFKIEQYGLPTTKLDDNKSYGKLNDDLLNYTPLSYRKNIYPFNSNLYLSYINDTEFRDDNFKFNGTLKTNLKESFICSPVDAKKWVKSGYETNLFSQKLTAVNTQTNILNTPYFHNQIYFDFLKTYPSGKYVGSAYLLLNSLPFLDLEDENRFGFSPFPISSLFREVGSTHFVPYHLMLKWGSIYHRYKTHIETGYDIIGGCINTGNTSFDIDGGIFFNDNETGSQFTNFTISAVTMTGNTIFNVSYTGNTDVGIHPFYDAIYHQVVNDYDHYIIFSGDPSYSYNVNLGAIKHKVRQKANNLNYWTGIVDNSIFDSKDLRYTLLPCDGDNAYINKTNLPPTPLTTTLTPTMMGETFDKGTQNNFRILWEDDYINNDFSGLTFPSNSQYFKSFQSGTTRTDDKQFLIYNDYRKVIDLIGTFSPAILERFEQYFLEFATERQQVDLPYKRFSLVKHDNFQNLLKEICSVKKETTDSTDFVTLISQIKTKQQKNLIQITTDMLSADNLIKISLANPKEIDYHVFDGFSKLSQTNTFAYNGFYSTQLTPTNLNYIKLYIGEDIDNYYRDFFIVNDVEISEDNVKQFRQLALMYAGYRKNGGTNTNIAFKTYVKESVFLSGSAASLQGTSVSPYISRLYLFLYTMINQFPKLESKVDQGNNIIKGYNNKELKLELYNTFKSFNDKWVAGNSLGQRLLMEEFLFLDKANKDIGDKVYMNLDKFVGLLDHKNSKLDLYGALAYLIAGTNMDMRSLPAYVNFYGTTITSDKITPSKNVAANVFGTFLEVDYQESTPKTIIQYVGPTSKYPDMPENKKFGFNDDSFDISSVNNNPLVITTPEIFTKEDFAKSNKVVAFEVSFGDQNQGIFKGVSLDQSSIKNTSESFVVMENLARSESGAGTYNVDIGLYDIYRQASYTCDVTCMGDVMIQPTMFFYLKNIPMFKGSYWITEVSHSIKGNNITTTFKGTRIPIISLPDPGDSFMSSYKPLFDKIMQTAIARVKNADKVTKTTVTVSTPNGNYETDIITPLSTSPTETLVQDAGITSYGVPYNGFEGEKYIQKVKYDGTEYFRTRVCRMGSTIYQINDNTTMSLVNQTSGDPLKWSEIKNTSDSQEFYSLRFNKSNRSIDSITSAKITFHNPNKKTTFHDVYYSVTGAVGSRKVTGQINIGPNVDGYGIGMSQAMMETLNLVEGDIVYFYTK